MHHVRQIPFALLALALLAMPALAETAPDTPRGAVAGMRGDAPGAKRGGGRDPRGSLHRVMNGLDAAMGKGRALAQSAPDDPAPADYDDMMDDVDAVIDAMSDDEAAAPAAGFVGKTSPDAPDLDQLNGKREASGAATAPTARSRQGPHARSPVVVELFTAQGCAACPTADDLLADLAGRPNVLALSWHVDYWDYLGWADDFARPEFSLRQKGYNRNWGARSLFTPQMVVGGETPIDLPRPADVAAAIDFERAEGDHVSILRRESGARREIELIPQDPLPPSIAVQLIRYLPERTVEVREGENRGRKLTLRNVVAASEVLARWDGRAPLRLTVTLGAGRSANLPPDTRHALIVQQMKGNRPGEIFAAIRLD
ncbi:thioredoxin family protein [Paracoccus sp. S1E-3]|uniref:DUF1223 domain-containing protein n=1 Tax=Paracoccus sp. S1E-3 TaxID=2756130 RepID=UPI0015EE5596|nr:DUF1223 domain-containing protein [Paracoccus sp. S1E-3]MBA4491958.1 DUF1223 domain-containing protein [Paracoccus sp. S1E-3]